MRVSKIQIGNGVCTIRRFKNLTELQEYCGKVIICKETLKAVLKPVTEVGFLNSCIDLATGNYKRKRGIKSKHRTWEGFNRIVIVPTDFKIVDSEKRRGIKIYDYHKQVQQDKILC